MSKGTRNDDKKRVSLTTSTKLKNQSAGEEKAEKKVATRFKKVERLKVQMMTKNQLLMSKRSESSDNERSIEFGGQCKLAFKRRGNGKEAS
jgi:hypothetical protein